MYFLIFLNLILLTTWVIASIAKLLKDKEPKSTVIYKIRLIDFGVKLLLPLTFFLGVIICNYIIINDHRYVLLILIVIILMSILSIPPVVLFIQYYRIERNRQIEFDPLHYKITIFKNGERKEIQNTDIQSIEEFPGTAMHREPFNYQFISITLADNSNIILTNLTTDLSNFNKLFKGVKKRNEHKNRIFNSIKTHVK